jgi:DNA polymerase-3 subunit epsilon
MWWKKPKQLPEFWQRYLTLMDSPPPKSLEEKTFVVLDTETTGFHPKKDRIISFGAIKVRNNSIILADCIEFYISQDHYDAQSAPIHGILQSETKNQLNELEALEKIIDYLANHYIVAHHAGFDVRMINQALKRHGLSPLKNKVFDTGYLHRKSLIHSPLVDRDKIYSLDELAEKYDIPKKDRHTALGDAYITALLFLKISHHIKEKDKRLLYR